MNATAVPPLFHTKSNLLLLPRRQPASAAASAIQPESASLSPVRRLILLRHAQSSWDTRSIRDHDRPLSNTGIKDAVKVSRKLQSLGWIPQLIISSDARRTRETLRIMQEEVEGLAEAEVHLLSSFYSVAAMDGQTAEHVREAVCEYAGDRDEIDTVMCMGHNRGWEEAASVLCGASVELKTCNAALLQAHGDSWQQDLAVGSFMAWSNHMIHESHASCHALSCSALSHLPLLTSLLLLIMEPFFLLLYVLSTKK